MASGEDHQALTNGNTDYAADEAIPGEKVGLDFIYISDNKLKYINNDYKKVNATMYDYKCDVKITVGKSNFKGHKKVLADASDYFAAMFSHDMKEKDETTIDLKEISPDGFSAMLDYFYHGHVTVEAKIVPDILEAARFFHVEWILDICCDYMIRHLSLSDYPLTMQLADKYSLGDLRWEIFKYFGHNLPTLIEQETFLRDCSVELLLQFLMECLYVEVSEFFLLQVRYYLGPGTNILFYVGTGLPNLRIFARISGFLGTFPNVGIFVVILRFIDRQSKTKLPIIFDQMVNMETVSVSLCRLLYPSSAENQFIAWLY